MRSSAVHVGCFDNLDVACIVLEDLDVQELMDPLGSKGFLVNVHIVLEGKTVPCIEEP